MSIELGEQNKVEENEQNFDMAQTYINKKIKSIGCHFKSHGLVFKK